MVRGLKIQPKVVHRVDFFAQKYNQMTKNTTFRLADGVRTPICDVICTTKPKGNTVRGRSERLQQQQQRS